MEIVSDVRKLTMSGLAAALTVFATSPNVMVPSSVQEFIIYALCAILLYHLAKIVLFSTKTVTGYLATVSKVLLAIADSCEFDDNSASSVTM